MSVSSTCGISKPLSTNRKLKWLPRVPSKLVKKTSAPLGLASDEQQLPPSLTPCSKVPMWLPLKHDAGFWAPQNSESSEGGSIYFKLEVTSWTYLRAATTWEGVPDSQSHPAWLAKGMCFMTKRNYQHLGKAWGRFFKYKIVIEKNKWFPVWQNYV